MATATDLPQVLSNVVIVQQDESDYFLVNLERGDSVAVSAAEARVFEGCRKGISAEVLARALAVELSANEDETLKRVRAAVEHFRQAGLCAA